MNDAHASCSCGCCAGLGTETPAAKSNAPGLPAVAYRVGTYAEFRDTLLARLSATDFPALATLTTRRPEDFTVALIDALSTMADVLTFYQERIANESYLRTAVERRSVLELAALIGYQLAPGVAAGTSLAFTLESAPGARALAAQPVTIPVGTRAQSVPDGGQSPQTFETTAAITGRVEWNAVPAQRAESIAIANGVTKEIYVEGIATQLQPGDAILIVGDERLAQKTSNRWDVRWLEQVEPDNARNVTRLAWSKALGSAWASSPPASKGIRVHAFRQRAALFGHNAPNANLVKNKDNEELFEGVVPNARWKGYQIDATGKAIDLDAAYPKIVKGSWFALTGGEDAGDDVTGYVELYRVDGVSQRSHSAFGLSGKVTRLRADTDANLPLFALDETTVLAQSEELRFADRPLLYPLYGSTLGFEELVANLAPGQLLAVSGKRQRVQVGATTEGIAFVGAPTRVARPRESFVMLAPPTRTVSGASQALEPAELDPVAPPADTLTWTLRDHDGSTITVEATADLLMLIPARASDDVVNEVVAIAPLADAIKSVGERTLVALSTALINCYDRQSTTVNANVAPATHGETVSELVGSGDARRPSQTFRLKQSPLTYVTSASDPSGRASTLTLRANDVAWSEVASLYGHGPIDRVYDLRQDDDGVTTVAFGDGVAGARLPSGANNVRATYRKGLGVGGNLRAGQITTLLGRPLGVKTVNNPVPAAGGQDPEGVADARRNAPVKVLTLDRAVSTQDYADLARGFAGVAKATAVWIGTRPRGIYVTVAGIDGAAVTDDGGTLSHLIGALRRFGDPLLPLTVRSYGAATFGLAAQIRLQPDADETLVPPAVTAALEAAFAFDARELGQPLTIGEVYAVVQSVPGVRAVTVSKLYRTDTGPGPSPATRLLAAASAPQDDGTVSVAELLTLDPKALTVEVAK